MKFLKEILVFLIIQALGWGGSWYLRSNDINYLNHYILFGIYFLFISLILLYIFRNEIKPFLNTPTIYQVILLISTLSLAAILYSILSSIPSILQVQSIFASNSYFLTFDFRYLFSKSFEILFQQTTVLIFLSILSNKIKSFKKIQSIFFIFPILHLVNYVYLPIFEATFLFIGSILASLSFPYIILKKKDGFLYTYCLHWGYYLVGELIILIIYY